MVAALQQSAQADTLAARIVVRPANAEIAVGDSVQLSAEVRDAAGTVVPHKLAVLVRYSNEVADDSVPALEGVLRTTLAARGAVSIDTAAFQARSGMRFLPKRPSAIAR